MNQFRKQLIAIIVLCLITVVIIGSVIAVRNSNGNKEETTSEKITSEITTESKQTEITETAFSENTEEITDVEETDAEGDTWASASLPASVTRGANGYIVAIDPGHQASGNYDKEANGPGSDIMKNKVAGGTSGVATGKAEYELTLEVAMLLKQELLNRGYTVVMIRESNDVDISNAERAMIANDAGADAFIRLHGNGVDDAGVRGALTMCQSPDNPYNGDQYAQSRRLSDCVINSYCESTGFGNRGVTETDTMTGINWSKVPNTIIEMGFMTNPEEDLQMSDSVFQAYMASGIANGIDAYFGL